ncbi:MAG: 3'-5' exonuclease [Gammaproteobacteria bacterium]|nr:3'-5' exonuclease [Gammaproteobacteria bacterium]
MKPMVAIYDDFLEAYAAIPKAQQKKVMSFVTKFRHGPFSSGINYEKINDAADPNFRSVRIDQDYRGIVLSPEQGNVYILLWVAKHDDAYDWARNHTCQVHPETGSLQLFESATESALAPDAAKPDADTAPPLFDLRDRELLRLGIPENRLDLVKSLRTEEALEAIEDQLPVDAFEALYLIAAGSDPEEIMQEYAAKQAVDTSDFAAALQRNQSQRSFCVVEDDKELEAMLSAPLEKWRVFLHPSQRRLVEWNTNGPIRVLGGAGTGKTVVAMHRTRWLVRQVLAATDKRVLFTTFTANLATDIKENLRKIMKPEDLQRVEVTHVDQWVSRFLKQHKYPHQIVYDSQQKYRRCWQLAMDAKPAEPDLPESFFKEEWERIILHQRITDRKEYFQAKRTGRGVALTRAQRAAIWPVFEEMRIQLHQKGLRTIEDATQDAADLLDGGQAYPPFAAVVVDEAQDMGPEVMRLIRRLAPKGGNDLFIVGDGHQRIYRRRYALSACGIEVRGRSRKLRINYRTTEETRRFAVSVLEDQPVDDLDDGTDTESGYRSLMHGEPPQVKGFSTQAEEFEWLAEEIGRLHQAGEPLKNICIVARTNALLEAYEAALQERGIACARLSRKQPDDRNREGVRLATMHRVKGLEFRYVIIVAVNHDIIPLRHAVQSTEDPTEQRATELTERALLHVSATRAINALAVTYYGAPSPFLHES